MTRPTLTAEAIVRCTGAPLRTVQARIRRWRQSGPVRVYQQPRADASGRPVGGVQWVVDAGDYRDLLDGRVPAEGVAQAA